MSYKDQRKAQIDFLMSMVDGTLINYEWLYNEEKVEFKCNKCSTVYNYNFTFLYTKIKHNQFCSCHKSHNIDILESFTLSEFDKTVKEVNEAKTNLSNQKHMFLFQESKQIMHIISKNRGAKNYTFVGKLINITCKNNHKFAHKYDDIVKGKWCQECELDETYYFIE